jgi:putative transposase
LSTCADRSACLRRRTTWKKKYADLGVTELRRLKMLEDENSRLKRIVADLTLDKHILQEVVRKKL